MGEGKYFGYNKNPGEAGHQKCVNVYQGKVGEVSSICMLLKYFPLSIDFPFLICVMISKETIGDQNKHAHTKS